MFAWLEATLVARTIGNSLPLTASLSAIHLLGFTLITGSALVANLRLLGVLFVGRPAIDIAAPASRAIAVGLAISMVTGALLFSPRAVGTIGNDTFQLKMLLLIVAASFHFAVQRRVAARAAASTSVLRLTGAVGLALWLGLALAGCAFILFE